MQNLSVCGLGQVQDIRIKEDKMRLQILTVTTSMFILASGMAGVESSTAPRYIRARCGSPGAAGAACPAGPLFPR